MAPVSWSLYIEEQTWSCACVEASPMEDKAKWSSEAPNILPPEIKQLPLLRNKVHDVMAMSFL